MTRLSSTMFETTLVCNCKEKIVLSHSRGTCRGPIKSWNHRWECPKCHTDYNLTVNRR